MRLRVYRDGTLRLVKDSLKLIRVALSKLREQGFQEVFIATDHGFSKHIDRAWGCLRETSRELG